MKTNFHNKNFTLRLTLEAEGKHELGNGLFCFVDTRHKTNWVLGEVTRVKLKWQGSRYFTFAISRKLDDKSLYYVK